MVLQLCLTFGLSARTAWTASIISALGFGSLYTLHDAYTSDPLMYRAWPADDQRVVARASRRGRRIGAVGVFAKEFAAAPLFSVRDV